MVTEQSPAESLNSVPGMVLYFFFRDSFILRRERREDERLIQLGFPKASKKTGLRE